MRDRRVIDRNVQTNRRPRQEVVGDSGAEARSYRRSDRRHGPRLARWVALLFAVFVGVLIARQEIPAFNDWWEKTFSQATWLVRNSCREAVFEDLAPHSYPRVLKPGELHNTADGPFIEGLRIAVLGEQGDEMVMEYSCYLDNDGHLYKLVREQR
jgi:hypothetical protein